jgi:hypothetical protein
MRVADLLRAMISMVDAEEQKYEIGNQQPTVVVVNNTPAPQAPTPQAPTPQPAHALNPVAVDNDDSSEPGVFVPPLQQKIELLKKSVGVNNVFDQDTDELEKIKKYAGINPVAVDEAGSDEPLDI